MGRFASGANFHAPFGPILFRFWAILRPLAAVFLSVLGHLQLILRSFQGRFSTFFFGNFGANSHTRILTCMLLSMLYSAQAEKDMREMHARMVSSFQLEVRRHDTDAEMLSSGIMCAERTQCGLPAILCSLQAHTHAFAHTRTDARTRARARARTHTHTQIHGCTRARTRARTHARPATFLFGAAP